LIVLRRSFAGVPTGANETNVVILALVLLLPRTVHADRITRMNQSDLCIYGISFAKHV
jgi:hypothetical protein